MLTNIETHVEELLKLLPADEHDDALRTLARLPYSPHRLIAACERGEVDPWTLKSALQKLKLDCRPEAVG